MHQQVYIGTDVYDAALAFDKDLSAATWENPTDGWPQDGYWQTILSQTPLRAYGLVFRNYNESCGDSITGYYYDENNVAQIGPPNHSFNLTPDLDYGPETSTRLLIGVDILGVK